jgi:hypothetical protein
MKIAIGIILASAGVLFLGGCKSSSMSGKVIAGDASVALVVGNDDDRMKGGGLDGVDVEVRIGQGRSLLGKATSGPDGSWSISIPDPKMVGDRLSVFAKGQGLLPSRGEVYFPGDGRSILVVMKRSAPMSDKAVPGASAK